MIRYSWLVACAAVMTIAASPAPVDPAPTVAHGAALPASLATAPLIPGIMLRKDTPIRLMVMTEVSTKMDMAGHRFRLAVDEPVLVDGKIAIPEGTPAWGEVTATDQSGNLGKAGSLGARLLYIDIGGTHLAINGETQAKGHTASGETVLAVLALGPFGLLAKGNNAKIKAGERMTAFVTEDMLLPASPPATKPS